MRNARRHTRAWVDPEYHRVDYKVQPSMNVFMVQHYPGGNREGESHYSGCSGYHDLRVVLVRSIRRPQGDGADKAVACHGDRRRYPPLRLADDVLV
ncbi:hypothetical protein NITLEN_10319 [Nitrospira lenta]|uniref:Uncharacterized protein n=1 Tax=Nitrospira lenta TaxID=1436998 RepID=A0A330L1Z8_9BACT|nr:hypothetical protein NITLEN_10319 [Nitrospira lenta]